MLKNGLVIEKNELVSQKIGGGCKKFSTFVSRKQGKILHDLNSNKVKASYTTYREILNSYIVHFICIWNLKVKVGMSIVHTII